jgi:hypothetical protein
MSSFTFGLRSGMFNLCLTNGLHFIGDTLQKKVTECRGRRLSLAATAAQSSILPKEKYSKKEENVKNVGDKGRKDNKKKFEFER